MDPSTLLEEIKDFFTLNFPKFTLVEPEGGRTRYQFYRNFKDLRLYIIVFMPIKIEDGKLVFIKDSEKEIDIELRIGGTKKMSVGLIGTRTQNGWRSVLTEKIEALEELLRYVVQCDDCGNLMAPRVSQNKKSQTWFVSLYCKNCRKWKSTTYGVGLKTRLHKYLKRQRT